MVLITPFRLSTTASHSVSCLSTENSSDLEKNGTLKRTTRFTKKNPRLKFPYLPQWGEENPPLSHTTPLLIYSSAPHEVKKPFYSVIAKGRHNKSEWKTFFSLPSSRVPKREKSPTMMDGLFLIKNLTE